MMFVMLLTGLSARGFHSKELVHDLDHHRQTSIATLGISHTGAPESGENSKSEPFDEMEHQLFHVVGTSYLLAGSAASFVWDACSHIVVPASSSPSLPVVALEPPFRPPRSATFI